MKQVWFIVGLVALLLVFVGLSFAQQEQYPGQSSHAEPPKDWFCSNHPRAPKSHKCDCHRTCAKPKDEDGNEIEGPLAPVEDPKCSVWCFQSHCACPTSCDSTH